MSGNMPQPSIRYPKISKVCTAQSYRSSPGNASLGFQYLPFIADRVQVKANHILGGFKAQFLGSFCLFKD